MIAEIDLDGVKQKLKNEETFVLNIVAQWCPDCTERQAPNLPEFANTLQKSGLPLFNLQVQIERRVYISQAYESFVNELGGHGFPRTVLFVEGRAIDTDNVEVLSANDLAVLANRFAQSV